MQGADTIYVEEHNQQIKGVKKSLADSLIQIENRLQKHNNETITKALEIFVVSSTLFRDVIGIVIGLFSVIFSIIGYVGIRIANNLEKQRKKNEENFRVFRDKNEKDYRTFLKEANQELKSIRDDISNKLTALDIRFENKLTSIVNQANVKISELDETFEKKLTLITNTAKLRVDQLVTDIEKQLTGKVHTLESNIKRDLELVRNTKAEINKLLEESRVEKNKFDNTIKQEIKQVTEDIDLKLKELEKYTKGKSQDITNTFTKEIDNLKNPIGFLLTNIFQEKISPYYKSLSEVVKSQKESKIPLEIERDLNELIYQYEIFDALMPNKLQLDARMYLVIGVGYNKRKAYHKAVKVFSKLITLEPSETAYIKYGVSLACINENKQALTSFDKAIAIDANNAVAYYNKAKVLKRIKNYTAAIQVFKKCIAIDKDYLQAFINLGNVYYEIQNYQKALEEYEKAKAIDKNHATIYFNIACVYADTGMGKTSVLTELKKAFQLNEKLYEYALKEKAFETYRDDIAFLNQQYKSS